MPAAPHIARLRAKVGNDLLLLPSVAVLPIDDDDRVLFGFWRGKRMLDIEPRMTGTGKYEMKTLELREETPIDSAVAERLIREAIRLNQTIGNPQERK